MKEYNRGLERKSEAASVELNDNRIPQEKNIF